MASGDDVIVSVEIVPTETLREDHAAALGGRTEDVIVVDVNILVNGVTVSRFGLGQITVSIPYTPKDGEDTDALTIWFLKNDGSIVPMDGSYDPAAGCVSFVTDHLSSYVIVRFPFSDVSERVWYYLDVAFAYNDGIFSGIGSRSFGPDMVMNRGMVVTVLYRLEGAPAVTSESAYTDVTGGQYYTDAVIWGTANGIVEGYGNGTFGPERPITRQQMAAVLHRYAQFKGYDLSASADLSGFVDADRISEYAQAPSPGPTPWA